MDTIICINISEIAGKFNSFDEKSFIKKVQKILCKIVMKIIHLKVVDN